MQSCISSQAHDLEYVIHSFTRMKCHGLPLSCEGTIEVLNKITHLFFIWNFDFIWFFNVLQSYKTPTRQNEFCWVFKNNSTVSLLPPHSAKLKWHFRITFIFSQSAVLTQCRPYTLTGVWLLKIRHQVRLSQMPWGSHVQGWLLAQGRCFQPGLLPWPHLIYSSCCHADECLPTGAVRPRCRTTSWVLAILREVLDLPHNHGLVKWCELSVDLGGHPQPFLVPLTPQLLY